MKKIIKGQSRDESVSVHGDLEIEASLEAQERLWKLQRYSRYLALVILSLALFGLFGGGPMSESMIQYKEATVKFQKVGYQDSSLTYAVAINSGDSEIVDVRLSHQAFEDLNMEKVVPEPLRTRITPEWVIYQFDTSREPGVRKIFFFFEPENIGIYKVKLAIDKFSPVEFKQVILP